VSPSSTVKIQGRAATTPLRGRHRAHPGSASPEGHPGPSRGSRSSARLLPVQRFPEPPQTPRATYPGPRVLDAASWAFGVPNPRAAGLALPESRALGSLPAPPRDSDPMRPGVLRVPPGSCHSSPPPRRTLVRAMPRAPSAKAANLPRVATTRQPADRRPQRRTLPKVGAGRSRARAPIGRAAGGASRARVGGCAAGAELGLGARVGKLSGRSWFWT
jgi:hypothetical protein